MKKSPRKICTLSASTHSWELRSRMSWLLSFCCSRTSRWNGSYKSATSTFLLFCNQVFKDKINPWKIRMSHHASSSRRSREVTERHENSVDRAEHRPVVASTTSCSTDRSAAISH